MLSINISDLLKLNNPNIIDIRGVDAYNIGHIPNSRNIPSYNLLSNPSLYLNKGQKYFIYCSKGYTSIEVCGKLLNMGYNVININGGYNAWLLNTRK